MQNGLDKSTRRALQELAREQLKHRLLQDVLFDLHVCKLEGWDGMEFIKDLKKLLNIIKRLEVEK